MSAVTSKDGTQIDYEQTGSGPAMILVAGALGVRSTAAEELAQILAPHFTVIDYDRRGRGKSGDTAPYAVEREIEDIEALIDAAGGTAYLYGISSGSVLALETAARLPGKVKKLLMYEPPFIINASRPPVPVDFVAQLNKALAAGRPGDAIEIFLTQAPRMPAEAVKALRQSPEWSETEKLAPTTAYDGTIMDGLMSGEPLPKGRWNANTAPTLVITGGKSPAFFPDGAKALVQDLPDAKHRILEGQDHGVAPEAIAPVLIEFFNAQP